MDSIKDNASVRCVLFHSLVPNVFCAGADLKERLAMAQEEVGPFVSKIKEIFSKIFGLPIPTIAALDGKRRDHTIPIEPFPFQVWRWAEAWN